MGEQGELIVDDLLPFARGVFGEAEDGSGLQLLGGRCAVCGRIDFPRPLYCRTCLEPVDEVGLGGQGTLHCHTVVRTRAPFGLPEPYAVGYVDLDGSRLRVFCLLDPSELDRLRPGLPVRLAAAPLGDDGRGHPRRRPYFTPADGMAGSARSAAVGSARP
jgi:uncharacterized OB-fold protein